jgi:hypothetical protein
MASPDELQLLDNRLIFTWYGPWGIESGPTFNVKEADVVLLSVI